MALASAAPETGGGAEGTGACGAAALAGDRSALRFDCPRRRLADHARLPDRPARERRRLLRRSEIGSHNLSASPAVALDAGRSALPRAPRAVDRTGFPCESPPSQLQAKPGAARWIAARSFDGPQDLFDRRRPRAQLGHV